MKQLTALRQTARTLDDVQLKLASGKDVNSAIDNPQNFFAATALDNKANNKERLLDGINQSIRTLETTTTGASKISDLLDLAEQNADTALAEQGGLSPIADGENNAISVARAGNSISINGLDVDTSTNAKATVEFWMEWDGTNNTMPFSFGRYDLYFAGGNFGFNTFGSDIYGISSAELEGKAVHVAAVFTDSNVAENKIYINGVEQTLTQRMGSFRNNIAQLTSNAYISGTPNSPGNYAFGGLLDEVRVWDGERTLSEIRSNMRVSIAGGEDNLLASYTFEDIEDGADGVPDDSGNGADGTMINITAANNSVIWDDPDLSTLLNAQIRAQAHARHIEILAQIDNLILDANYRGVNLLAGESMQTQFNEWMSSGLTTEGIDASADGLGISRDDFVNNTDLRGARDQAKNAREKIRRFTTSIQNDLTIIRTRQNVTRESINTLRSGADDLIVADQNQTGAQYLALQTRQAVQFNTMSLSANTPISNILI